MNPSNGSNFCFVSSEVFLSIIFVSLLYVFSSSMYASVSILITEYKHFSILMSKSSCMVKYKSTMVSVILLTSFWGAYNSMIPRLSLSSMLSFLLLFIFSFRLFNLWHMFFSLKSRKYSDMLSDGVLINLFTDFLGSVFDATTSSVGRFSSVTSWMS